jgi:hypothetical protein
MYRVIQTGAATASIVADNAWGTVNVNFVAGQNVSAGQWGVLFARKRAANSWIIWRQG